MLNPAFALVSMNITFNSRALASPSSIDTCLANIKKQNMWWRLSLKDWPQKEGNLQHLQGKKNVFVVFTVVTYDNDIRES